MPLRRKWIRFFILYIYGFFTYVHAGEDFYGRYLRMLLVGFQRREKKFASFPELVANINKVSQKLHGKARAVQ